MTRLPIPFITAFSLLAPGCTHNTPAPSASFPPATTLKLTTPRCADGKACACRDPDADSGQSEESIPAGRKRFEVRLPQTPTALWVSVEGQGVFYKPADRIAPVCFYLDLAPGEHPVTLHAEKRDPEVGLQAGLSINEYGPKEGPHWYRSLDFVCGGTDKCTKGLMEAWTAAQRRLPRGVLDPCGSTMIRSVTVSGTREEHLNMEYQDLTLRFSLKVYGFETHRSPGSPDCRAPVQNQ